MSAPTVWWGAIHQTHTQTFSDLRRVFCSSEMFILVNKEKVFPLPQMKQKINSNWILPWVHNFCTKAYTENGHRRLLSLLGATSTMRDSVTRTNPCLGHCHELWAQDLAGSWRFPPSSRILLMSWIYNEQNWRRPNSVSSGPNFSPITLRKTEDLGLEKGGIPKLGRPWNDTMVRAPAEDFASTHWCQPLSQNMWPLFTTARTWSNLDANWQMNR